MGPGAARARIDHPDIADAEPQVIINSFLHLAHAVIPGENFDGDQGRLGEDLLGWLGAGHDADIRNAEARRRYLNALLDKRVDVQTLSQRADISVYLALQFAVISFSHVSLHDLAVYVIAVGIVAGVQVFIHRNERSGGHVSILALQLLGDLRGHGARLLHRTRLEADSTDARMATTAIALTNCGEIVLGLMRSPGVRAYGDLGAETGGTYRDSVSGVRKEIIGNKFVISFDVKACEVEVDY